MRFTLEKEFRFEASHRLVDHDGKCARLHGHSFKAKVICGGSELITSGPKAGMLVDYGDIKAAAQPVIDKLDHYHLNDVLAVDNPTSELLAVWIYNQIKPMLPSLCAVVVEETCTSRCCYGPDA